MVGNTRFLLELGDDDLMHKGDRDGPPGTGGASVAPDLSKFELLRISLIGRLTGEILENFESMYEAGEWKVAVEWLSDNAHDADLRLRDEDAHILLELGIEYQVERLSFVELTRGHREP